MKRVWPIIAVADVQLSAKWYEDVLRTSRSGASSALFEQILSEDFEVLICLHRLETPGSGAHHRWDAFRSVSECAG